MLFLAACIPHLGSVYIMHIQILILTITLLANIVLFRVPVKWQDTYTTLLDWHTGLQCYLSKKMNNWRKKEADFFYPGWQTGISSHGVLLTEHYILRNINIFLNLYLLAIILFLFVSLFLVSVAYVPLAFPQRNYLAGALTVYLK